jgi:hypothetical protein
MSDIVTEATDAIVPLLSLGVGAAARDVAERSGVQLSEKVSAILSKLRRRLKDEKPSPDAVAAALRSALAADEVSAEDLKVLIAVGRNAAAGHVEGDIHAKTVIDRSTIRIKGDFNA